MKRFGPIEFILALFALLGFPFRAEAQQYVLIDGVVKSELTLQKLGADSTYLVMESLSVIEDGSLIIEPGVRICFAQSAFLRVDGGRLSVQGSYNDSVYLFPYELSHNWRGVQLKNLGTFNQTNFAFVSMYGAEAAITASNCEDIQIKRCGFLNDYAGKGVDLTDCSRIVIDSCLFNQCVLGIELKSRSKDCSDNMFSHSVFSQGQINISVENASYGWKCRNNHISGNCFQGAATALYFDRIGGIVVNSGKNFVEDNVISSGLPSGSVGYSSYGIKVGMDSLVIRNNVFWKNDEAINMLRSCHLMVQQNTFHDNGKTVTELSLQGTSCFLENVFSEVTDVVAVFPSSNNELHRNNFFWQGTGVLFVNDSPSDVSMTENYWHGASPEEIEELILDANDNPYLGRIVYDNILIECDTVAPISPPANVKKQYVNGRWKISWDENPEPDLSHYVLFYGDFDRYRFSNHEDSIIGNSFVLPVNLAENVAVIACDGKCDLQKYASRGKSAYSFASFYPYAGEDAVLCSPSSAFAITNASIPYSYNSFLWRTSGTGRFVDAQSLRTSYLPSEEDFAGGSVVLTLRVVSDDEVKTASMTLFLKGPLSVFAGNDAHSGIQSPISLDEASANNCDSVCWKTMGDGFFVDPNEVKAVYYPGEMDKENGTVRLVVEAWSFCGYASDTVTYELHEEFSLEGRVWAEGEPFPNAQVLAVAMGGKNESFLGFYKTISDEMGKFRFGNLLSDVYVVYAFPDTLDVKHSGAYYWGDMCWNEADVIKIEGNACDVDVVLPVLSPGFSMGEGSISGVFDYPETQFKAGRFYCQSWLRESEVDSYCTEGISNVSVTLMNPSRKQALRFALTDEKGRFHFDNLPYGTYYIVSEIPRYGKAMCEPISITPDKPLVSDIHLYVNSGGRVLMRYGETEIETGNLCISPNPVIDRLIVDGLCKEDRVEMSIVNSTGTVVMSSKSIVGLDGKVCLNVGKMPSGVYLLVIDGGNGRQCAKFVKWRDGQ